MYQELTAISRLSFIHIVNFYWFIWTFSLFKSADFVHIDFKDFAALILQILQICLYMSGGINKLAVFSPVAIFAVCGCPEAQCLDAMLHNVSKGVWYFGKCLWIFSILVCKIYLLGIIIYVQHIFFGCTALLLSAFTLCLSDLRHLCFLSLQQCSTYVDLTDSSRQLWAFRSCYAYLHRNYFFS